MRVLRLYQHMNGTTTMSRVLSVWCENFVHIPAAMESHI